MSSTPSVSSLPLPPGPRGLPVLGSLLTLRRDLHISLNRLIQPYGDVCLVRLGSVPVVIISHPALLKEAFQETALTDRWITEAIFALTEAQTPASAPYGELWRQFDAFIRHEMFSADNLDVARKNHIEPVVNGLVERMHAMADAGEPVHPNAMLAQSACEMAFRMFFGEGEEQTAEFRQVMSHLQQHFDSVNSLTVNPDPADVFPWARFLPRRAVKMARHLRSVREEIFGPLVDTADSRPGADPSIPAPAIEMVLAEAKSKGFTRPATYGLLADTMQPHYDGVAATVKWFLLTVANRPQIQARIHEELDRVIGRDGLPTIDDQVRLPYTFAAIAECMRYRTASPLGIPHEASQDTEVGGYRVPTGTKVMSNLYGIHHDPRFWDSPDEFVPERFLPQADGTPSNALTGGAFIPFGVGLRRCTGERSAEIEIWLYITRLLHQFQFEVPWGGPLSEDEVHGMTVTPRPYTLTAARR